MFIKQRLTVDTKVFGVFFCLILESMQIQSRELSQTISTEELYQDQNNVSIE